MARARYEKKKLDEHKTRDGRTVQSPIVLSDERDEDEDDTTRLSDLIALAKAGLQTEEAEDDTDRLSELIALAEAGLQVEEDDDTFFTQAAEAADKAEAAYYRQHTGQSNAGEPNHNNKVVVEDWYSNDELLTQYVSDWGFESAFAIYVGFGVLMTSKLGTNVILIRYVAAISLMKDSNSW